MFSIWNLSSRLDFFLFVFVSFWFLFVRNISNIVFNLQVDFVAGIAEKDGGAPIPCPVPIQNSDVALRDAHSHQPAIVIVVDMAVTARRHLLGVF